MKSLLASLLSLFAFSIGFSQLSQSTFTFDGEERAYYLYLPQDLETDAPLVMVLHGYTSTASSIIDSYGMNDIADANGFAVCYPQGTQDLSGNEFWNINFPLESVDDIGFLSALAIDLTELYEFDENRTYVCGMSNGGMMSYNLGCARPDVFEAFASVTGTITSNFLGSCNGNITVPFMQIHGTADIVVPYTGGSIAAATFGEFLPVEQIFRTWNNINDCQSVNTFSIPNAPVIDNSSVVGAEVSDCDGSLKARFYRVVGGGHTWPGSPPVPIFDFLQPTNQDISASEEIWSFFESLNPSSEVTEPASDPEQVHLYPNPSRGDLFVELKGREQSLLTIISMDGRIVAERLIYKGTNLVTVNHLPKGIYLARIQGESLHVKKIIVE